jgi:hypothetical protein
MRGLFASVGETLTKGELRTFSVVEAAEGSKGVVSGKVRERETRSLDVEETQVGEGRLLVVDDGSLSLYWCVQTCGQEERMCGQLSE